MGGRTLARAGVAVVFVSCCAAPWIATATIPCDALTSPPGAIFLYPDTPTSTSFVGNNFLIDGNDSTFDWTPGPAPAVYGVAARTTANAEEVREGLSLTQYDNVAGKGFVANPPSPSVGVDGRIDAAMIDAFVSALLELPHLMITSATVTGFVALGDETAPAIAHLVGQGAGVTIGPGQVSGAGILIVEDALTVQGILDYAGLIIVRGPATVSRVPEIIGSLTLFGSLWTQGANLSAGGSSIAFFSSEALSWAGAAGGDLACAQPICGDGARTGDEACDDGNTVDGDCCSSTCTLEPNGAPCADGDACTDADTCVDGACAAGAPVVCGFCAQCDSARGCIGAPATGCRTPLAGKSQLAIRRTGVDVANRLTWRWRSSQGTVVDDFGDPGVADDYTLCLFGGPNAATLLSRGALLAGSICGDRTCWSATGRGWRWKDRERRTGIASLKLSAASTGKASIRALGGGVSLELPALPVEAPVLVQLRAGNGACWEAAFSAAEIEQTDRTLRARSAVP